MSSKLREVTFGTPIVLKVNNTAPDTNGNVTVQVGVTGIESTASGVKKITADSSCGMTFCGSETHCGYEIHSGCEYHNGYEAHSGCETHEGVVTFGGGGMETHNGCEYHNGYETHNGCEHHNGCEYHNGGEVHHGNITFTSLGTERHEGSETHCGYENHCGCEYHSGCEAHCGTEYHHGEERHCGYEFHCGDISFGKGTVTFTSCGEGGFVYFDGHCACTGDGYGNANILVTAIAFRGPNGEIKIIDYDKVKNL